MVDITIPSAGGDSIRNGLASSWKDIIIRNIPGKPVVAGQTNNQGSTKGAVFTITDIMLLSTASDLNSNTLSVSSVSYSGTDGNLVDNSDGTYTFTPSLMFVGVIVLDYAITDGFYETLSTYKHTYHQGNVAPLATAKTKNTAYETAVTITATELLVGATDANNDTLQIKEVTYTGSDGTVLYNGNDTWTFTPSSSFSGDVVLSFKVTDTLLDSASNTLTITVASQTANNNPLIENAFNSFTLAEDGSATIDLNNIFADAEDADSALVYTFAGNTNINVVVASGIATISNQTPDWNGTETVVFRATDTGSLFVEQSVDITVTPVVDIIVDNYNVIMDTQTDLDVLNNDTFEGSPVVSVVTQPLHGVTSVVSGIIKYTPTTSYSGPDSLTYRVVSGGVSEQITINLTVGTTNTPPSGLIKSYNGLTNTDFIIRSTDLLIGSTDGQGDTLTVDSVVYLGSDGTLSDNGNGTWTFNPTTDFTGTVLLSYTLTDTHLVSTPIQITLVFSGVNIVGNSAQFTNPPTETGLWSFGDGRTSTTVSPLHEYTVHGTYDVTFTSDTLTNLTYQVVIHPMTLPVASFNYVVGDPVSSTLSFVGSGGESYLWDIDGTSYTTPNPTHAFSTSSDGVYSVSCIVTDTNGNTAVVEENITVQIENVAPTASLTYTKNLLDVSFDSNGTDSDGANYNLTYLWDFGDGSSPVQTGGGVSTLQHTYPSPSTPNDPNGQEFTASVTVTDERGGSVVTTKLVKVYDYLAVGAELLPTGLVTMDNDTDSRFSRFGANTVWDFTTEAGTLHYSGDINQSGARLNLDVSGIGLQVGKTYICKIRVKAASGVGLLRSWTCGTIQNTPLVVDGVYHDYSLTFPCTNASGEVRIYHTETMNIDSISIKEEL